MSFDDTEFRRIILNYRVECKHEENLRLFICIFKIGQIETVELMFNFNEKNWEQMLQSTIGYRRTFKELYFVQKLVFCSIV